MATDRRGNKSETEELAIVIGLYVLGEISLGKAAQRLDISRWEMQEVLEANGVKPRLGPAIRSSLMTVKGELTRFNLCA